MRVVKATRIKGALAATAATLAFAGGAQATTITVQAFSPAAFGSLVTSNTVVEDFETPGDLDLTFEGGGSGNGTAPNNFGEIEAGTSIGSSVGTFTTVGGQGSGSTCTALSVTDNVCDNVALQFDPDVNGQGNIVPDNGQWSVNAADTLGIKWDAKLDSGKKFTDLFFAIRDAADQGGTTFTVEVDGVTKSFQNLDNNNEQLFLVDFGGAVSSATVTMTSSRVNDSFTIDGAAISPVPLPAAGWLMVAGLGGLVAMRRRRKAA